MENGKIKWQDLDQKPYVSPSTGQLRHSYSWVTESSRRMLTVSRDKLTALAGLMSQLAAATGGTYAAGLWVEDLVLGLASHVPKSNNHLTQRHDGRAPSWSWAALDAPVDWQCGEVKLTEYVSGPWMRHSTRMGDLEILNVEVDEVHPGSFGEVRGGRITAMGTLYKAKKCLENLQRDTDGLGWPQLKCFFDEKQHTSTDGHADSPSPPKYFLLQLLKIDTGVTFLKRVHGSVAVFLIIQHMGSRHEFQRVGYAPYVR